MSMQSTHDLTTLVTGAHARALAALEESPGDPSAAVAWSSTHLAASDSVLYPVARRRLPEGRRRVRAARAHDHLLQQALCRLDRRLTGASHLDALPLAAFVQKALTALRVHAENELELLELLLPRLDAAEQQELVDRMAAATDQAPTRPHPHTRHTLLSPLVARLDAMVDRARDVMDNRVVPGGRAPRPARPLGRWGCYAMGAPYPPAEDPARR